MRGTENKQNNNRLHHIFGPASRRAILPYLALGVPLIVVIIVAGHRFEHQISAFEAWISELGPWGLLAFIALFVLTTSVLISEALLSFIAGALFGLYWGVVVALAGNLLAGSLQFALAHRLFRARIRRILAARPSLAAIQRAVRRDEFHLQVLLRLTPLHPAIISYLLGAAGVRFSGFMVAFLAHSPYWMSEVYFGYIGKRTAELAGSTAPAARLYDLVMIGGVVMFVAVMVVVARVAHRAVMRAVAESDKTDSQTPPPE